MSTAYYDKILKQDLNLGTTTKTRRNPGGGSLTGNQINLSTFAVGGQEYTTSWNVGNIANGASSTTTVTVAGADLGDHVLARSSLDLKGLTCTAYVSSANTVTIVLANNSGSGQDVLTPTFGVLVFKV